MRRQRCAGDRVRRKHEAGQDVDLLAGDQFLNGGLGDITTGALGVTLDQFDIVAEISGMLLHVQFHTAADLLAELGCTSGKCQYDADFHISRITR